MDFSPINFRKALNDDQYAAVTAPPGPALVLAGAGSGKTRTLTYRVAWLMLEAGLHPDELLLLTFTNKAAKEMIERVHALTGIGQTPRWSGTFHSIGGRILRQYGSGIGLSPNYTILDSSDAESLLTTVIKDCDKAFLKNKDHPKAKVLHGIASYARNTRQALAEVLKDRLPRMEHLHAPIRGFLESYEVAKRVQQVADFDDLLILWLQLLRECPSVCGALQRHFPFIMVDEYQDTNTLQAEIIDTIGKHHNIMAVGDDAQCIYTWRGADFENIRSFPERHPGTKIYQILTNYRSTPPILDLANEILANQPGHAGYQKRLAADRKGKLKPYVVPLMDTRQQAQFLVSRIEHLYEEGIALRDIAVLYRAHYQALDAQLEFSRRGIPFIITSGVRFFEQAHVKDFVCQLRLLANPDDAAALERLLCLLPKVGPATVNKVRLAIDKLQQKWQSADSGHGDLFRAAAPDRVEVFFRALGDESVLAKLPADARADFVALHATLQELLPLLMADKPPSPAALVEQALDGWYGDFIRNVYPDWDNRLDDLNSIIEFSQRFDTLPELLAQLVLLNSETSDKRIDPEDQAVRMTTIHQAKGLEFPVVFLISCADEWLPLKRAIEAGDVDEERRLFYVAVTRAMDELYLSFPMMHAVRGGGVQRLFASRFISDIPAACYDKLQVRSTW